MSKKKLKVLTEKKVSLDETKDVKVQDEAPVEVESEAVPEIPVQDSVPRGVGGSFQAIGGGLRVPATSK